MTFSEYIKNKSQQDYITFCNKNRLVPVIDTKPEVNKTVCWLLQPNKEMLTKPTTNKP